MANLYHGSVLSVKSGSVLSVNQHFQRFAAKKALASSKNLFSSLRRRSFLSWFFICLRSIVSSSARFITDSGVWNLAPIFNLSILTVESQV